MGDRPLHCSIKNPILLTVEDQKNVFHSGCKVIDVTFPNVSTPEVNIYYFEFSQFKLNIVWIDIPYHFTVRNYGLIKYSHNEYVVYRGWFMYMKVHASLNFGQYLNVWLNLWLFTLLLLIYIYRLKILSYVKYISVWAGTEYSQGPRNIANLVRISILRRIKDKFLLHI